MGFCHVKPPSVLRIAAMRLGFRRLVLALPYTHSKIPIALTTFLSANPQIKTIVLHLDNDKVGRLCTATLKELLQKDYKIVDDPPPVGKDFNDFLLSYLKIARPKLKRERSDVR